MALILNTTWIKAFRWESDGKRKWAAVETLDSANFKQKNKRTTAATATAKKKKKKAKKQRHYAKTHTRKERDSYASDTPIFTRKTASETAIGQYARS
ncbi:hypothetical protein ACN9MH_24805 [Paenibacillus silvae]|uniref:hypothetical protein n=1 Tax=Paenibacillus silvae TaxID=1325358 RepID=UPI003CF7B93D